MLSCGEFLYHAGGLLSATLDPQFGRKVSRLLVNPFQGLTGTNSQSAALAFSDPRFSTDLFASAGLNAQFGLFERRFFDFTKLGVRLDLGAASTINSSTFSSKLQIPSPHGGEPGDSINERGHPTLALSLQQQVLFFMNEYAFSVCLKSLDNSWDVTPISPYAVGHSIYESA